MRKEHSTDPGFPGIAFATLPTTGETIAIRYGERIYYRVQTTKTAEELNAIYGVTEAQARTLLASRFAVRASSNPVRNTPTGFAQAICNAVFYFADCCGAATTLPVISTATACKR